MSGWVGLLSKEGREEPGVIGVVVNVDDDCDFFNFSDFDSSSSFVGVVDVSNLPGDDAFAEEAEEVDDEAEETDEEANNDKDDTVDANSGEDGMALNSFLLSSVVTSGPPDSSLIMLRAEFLLSNSASEKEEGGESSRRERGMIEHASCPQRHPTRSAAPSASS